MLKVADPTAYSCQSVWPNVNVDDYNEINHRAVGIAIVRYTGIDDV